ncbi:MAG: DUF2868 domain-containing protein [Halothiobacillaceae bacterium]
MPHALTPLESRWLAEVIRQHEAAGALLEDGDLLPQVLKAPADAETRILRRAELIGAREGWLAAITAWRGHARTTLLILALIALISGFGAALGVMGTGDRPVNVLWLLGSLLGVHLFSLALWLVGMTAGGPSSGALLGRAWWWLSDHLGTLGTGRKRDAVIGRALLHLLAQHGLLRWVSGSISHLLWLIALLGALVGLLLALALQRYAFIIETTILPSEVFVELTAALGWLPAKLGFAIPDADMVRASGEGLPQMEAARRAWSSWLVGCVVAYGILPRLLLWAGCQFLWMRGRNRLRLDLNLPGYAALRARLLPASERIGVIDQAPSSLPRARIQTHAAHRGQAHLLVGLELGGDTAWPPTGASAVSCWPVVDAREERQRLLEALRAHPPARLLVALDGRLSPDRGTLRYLTELADHADATHVWLIGHEPRDAERIGHWHEALQSIGLPSDAVMDDEQRALHWLEHGP